MRRLNDYFLVSISEKLFNRLFNSRAVFPTVIIKNNKATSSKARIEKTNSVNGATVLISIEMYETEGFQRHQVGRIIRENAWHKRNIPQAM